MLLYAPTEGRLNFVRLKLLFLILLLSASARGANPPVIFFTDLVSGPMRGNSDTTYSSAGGVYVTIYGNYFGSSQGSSTITLNGSPCLTVVSWGTTWMWYQKIVVKLGTSCTSGKFSVTVGGKASNCADIGSQGDNCQFTVRKGNIYYVSTSGSDSKGTGSFSNPWATLPHARNAMSPGDTTYAESGVCACADDGSGWATTFVVNTTGGTSGYPLAIVAYPGARVTMGDDRNSALTTVIRSEGSCGTRLCANESYWVFAGMYMQGYNQVFAPYAVTQWRVVGNDITCPNGNGQTGCFDSTFLTYAQILGNNMHNMGVSGASSNYQGLYFSTDSNHEEVGWNTIAYVQGCRGIQLNSTPQDGGGNNQFDFSIHDNVIHDTQCDGIVLGEVDPSKGPIVVYNNVIYNAGLGNTPESSGAWWCIDFQGWDARAAGGTNGAGNALFYNNTMYNCGPNSNPPYNNSNGGVVNVGHDTLQKNAVIQNNIIYNLNRGTCIGQTPCARYWKNQASHTNGVFGTNNLMYGVGTPPSSTEVTGTINSDPRFVSTRVPNFQLSSPSSPANAAGTPSTTNAPVPMFDITGLVRPSPPSIGAYEFAADAVAAQPNPPQLSTLR
jgi:hypothetical protein